MNKQDLLEKRMAIERTFNDLQLESHKLQGEYRLLGNLIEDIEKTEADPAVALKDEGTATEQEDK